MSRQKRVLTQHHQLDYRADRMRLLASAAAGTLRNNRQVYVLAHELRAFARAFRAHMRFEEEDGYFGEMLVAAPHLQRKVDELRAEHGEFEAMLVELLARDDLALDALQDGIHLLLDRISDHEQRENALLQAALYDEVGRGT